MSSIQLIDIIGVGIVLVVLVELIILSIKLYLKFSKNIDEKLPLWFALMFTFLAVGIIFLVFQQLSFRIIVNEPLGRFFTCIALLGSGTAAYFLNMISFDLTFPQSKNKLMIPIIITIVFLLITTWTFILIGEPFTYVQDGELFYMLSILSISYFFVAILCFIAPTVFLYFAIMNKENKEARNRSLWLAFALYLFGVAYILEVGPILSIIAVPMRATYIITTTILYIQFTRTPTD